MDNNEDNISNISSSTFDEETLNSENKKTIDKETLISIIRDWVKNDNEIRELKKEENIRKIANKTLTTKLIEIMRSNKLDCFDINDGCITYKKTNVKKPLSKKTMIQLLNEFYKNDTEKANEVSTFLIENREEVIKERIVRKLW
jgi:hypothetical protein